MAEMADLGSLIAGDEEALLDDWMREQLAATTLRRDLISEPDLRRQSAEFLRALREALERGAPDDLSDEAWSDTRGVLEELSRERARLGFTPTQTATFVFSLKQPLFALFERRRAAGDDAVDPLWQATRVLDRLGLYTTEVFQRSREEIIRRQQSELLELSTPVVQLWDGVVGVPLIGTLDSERTQVVMEKLLEAIVDDEASLAIIDITGVPTVDTLVAQHLIKTVSAARLMGAECVISGIRPQIAQTIVHLGIELTDVTTKATLADAIRFALRRLGHVVRPAEG
ncbi:MAG TPA: STAS domain-containing protein [Thermoanaerobaculia bacterium]|nr:STAS domain-containing protein [Thermoanaerobaculia bacterium]